MHKLLLYFTYSHRNPSWTDLHRNWYWVGVADVMTGDKLFGDRLWGSKVSGFYWQSLSPLTPCFRHRAASDYCKNKTDFSFSLL